MDTPNVARRNAAGNQAVRENIGIEERHARNYIGRIERGERNLGLPNIVQSARALKVPPAGGLVAYCLTWSFRPVFLEKLVDISDKGYNGYNHGACQADEKYGLKD